MVTLVKPVQEENAHVPISVTELPIVTSVKPVQEENAKSPIDVAELGMIMVFSDLSS